MTTPNYWWQIANATYQKVKAQTLPGIGVENMKLLPVADEKQLGPLPGVMVAPFGAETLVPGDGGNVADDPGYPVLVALVDSKQHVFDGGLVWLETWLQWRETLIAALHHKNGTDFTFDSSAISGQFDTVVIPGSVINYPAWQERQVAVGTFVLRASARRLHV